MLIISCSGTNEIKLLQAVMRSIPERPLNYLEKNKRERIPRSTFEGSVEFSETVDLKSHCRTPGASTDSCPDQSIRVRSVMG